MYDDMFMEDLPELKERAEVEENNIFDNEDTDEDDEFREICNTKNWCGRA
jgi:hypothetical protein